MLPFLSLLDLQFETVSLRLLAMRRHELPWKIGSWRDELAGAVGSLDQILKEVGLTRKSAGLKTGEPEETHGFAIRVPRAWIKRIVPGDPNDPLLLQILPRPEEGNAVQGFVRDPVAEQDQEGAVLRKYAGRDLVISTSACPIHCRYCFRRHFQYAGSMKAEEILSLAREEGLHELILSGGDPLMLPDTQLEELCLAAETLPNLRRLRIHSRMPVVIPQRVDQSLLDVLSKRCLPIVMALHINHPNEINQELKIACDGLRSVGVVLLNQSVLLRKINDSLEVQVELAEKLFDLGVLPYYLHLLDRVQGAAHFELPEVEARRLFGQMGQRLSGYLMPRLVREERGRGSKTLISPL